MDAAIVLLAATPVPALLYNAAMYFEEGRTSDLLGGVSSFWGILAVLFIYAGMPGSVFFPVMLGTSALGGYLEYGRSRRKWELVQGLVLTAVLIIVIALLGGI
ncbi:MAG: hypothetical protein FJ149_05750 [Euryarchaeota archaeon]|nr:hypothetical protein [Euryarchaeota archaeon]